MNNLRTKAIITGHSRGLGKSVATELLSMGIPVLGISRKANSVPKLRFPELLSEHQIDLADSLSFANWLTAKHLDEFAGQAQRLLVINNAGILGPIGKLAVQAPEEIARAVAVNVSAPLMLASYVAALGCEETRVLHVSSGAARDAYPGWSVYCATKAALDHHARAVSTDDERNLKICSLAPGVIDTDMQAEIRSSSTERFPLLKRFLGLKQEGLLSKPEDVACKLVRYLLSQDFGKQAVSDLRTAA